MSHITFIMPTYNRADYISESINSVLSQIREGDEFIVIDDGSTDETETVLRKFESIIQYVRQDNAGKSVALNKAMGMATGEFIWICDDDDLLRPGVVAKLSEAIDETGVDVVFGSYSRFRIEDHKHIDMGTGYWPDLSTGTIARHILEDAFIMHNATLVRRSAYDCVGPFDTRMLRSQDYEMFVRLALNCSFAFVPEAIFDQRKHEGARGPSSVLHAAGKSESVWQQYDTLIFEKMRDEVPLEYFEDMFQSDNAGIRKRASLLQRGCILGRHGLWADAILDFKQAALILPEDPLHSLEKDICRRAVSGKHGFHGLVVDDHCLQQLRQLSQGTGIKKEIAREIANGMIWRFRGEDKKSKGDALKYFSKMGGVYLGFQLLFRRLKKTKAVSTQLVERQNPAAALARHKLVS